jgi:hypothetical protein
VIGAIIVAAIADILSIFDVGWIISWAIPMICWVMVRRIAHINKGGDAIVEANKKAHRQLTILRQRLRPALLASGGAQFLAASTTSELSWKARSYVSTFIRDTAITQIAELVPFLDWLPFYIGQVVKMIVDQNIAYKKVKKLMPNLEHTLQLIDTLEQFELKFQARQLARILQIQQARAPRRQPVYA